MPTRRMIHNKISRSEQVNNLSVEAALLFTWMITHADDEGKLKGSSASVRATVFPMKELKNEDVEKLLQEIVDQDLIYRWSDEHGTYIEFPTWFKHQTLQKDRTKESLILSYRDYVSKMETGDIQNDFMMETQDNITQDNQTEENIIQGKEIENLLRERKYEGEPALIKNTTQLQGFGEHAAYRAWSLLDHENVELLEKRYLKIARNGAPTGKIILVAQEINKDDSILDKGKEFEKRMKNYMTKDKTTINE